MMRHDVCGATAPLRCTLRNFPHLIDHCIEWARDKFAESSWQLRVVL